MSEVIVYTNPEGGVSVVVPAPGFTAQFCTKDVPAGTMDHEIVTRDKLPQDRIFRNAWKRDAVKKVDIDVVKAKDITHMRRRAKREVEFAPHDEIIMKQIPGKDAAAAEAARANIRSKYAAIQIEIDACTTADELKTITLREGLPLGVTI